MDNSSNRSYKTILVVDEEPAIRRLLCDALSEKYAVAQAASGPEAMSVAAGLGGRIDLLITEVLMAGMHGVELATQLQQRDPELRVLFISDPSDVLLIECIKLSGAAFLQKPFALPDLLAKTDTLLAPPWAA